MYYIYELCTRDSHPIAIYEQYFSSSTKMGTHHDLTHPCSAHKDPPCTFQSDKDAEVEE
jgi:hypothetical protein